MYSIALMSAKRPENKKKLRFEIIEALAVASEVTTNTPAKLLPVRVWCDVQGSGYSDQVRALFRAR